MHPGANKNDAEEPMDVDNHTCDVIKYLVATRFQSSSKPEPVIVKHSVAYELEKIELEANDWKSKFN